MRWIDFVLSTQEDAKVYECCFDSSSGKSQKRYLNDNGTYLRPVREKVPIQAHLFASGLSHPRVFLSKEIRTWTT